MFVEIIMKGSMQGRWHKGGVRSRDTATSPVRSIVRNLQREPCWRSFEVALGEDRRGSGQATDHNDNSRDQLPRPTDRQL